MKAIYFEDVSLQKMREFRTLLVCFKNMTQTIDSLRTVWQRNELNSQRLIALVTTGSETENGLLPDNIEEELQEFDKLIKWKRVAGMSNAEIPEPQPGIDEVFDSANEFVV